MSYKIINNNFDSSNHFEILKDFFNKSDTIILVSPFLMWDFTDFLSKVNISNIKEMHIITTLKSKSADQIEKVNSLVSLIGFPEIAKKNIKCQISLDNKLHGKIYIFKKAGKYLAAIVSSANFTDNGLSKNHEWGIEITDDKDIAALECSVLRGIEFENISSEEIYIMQKIANNYKKTPKDEIDLDLTKYLGSPNWIRQLDNNITYWLKPIGVTENPVEEGRLFTEDAPMNFSKLKPKAVKPGDILIAYGVGTTKIIAIYRVMTLPERVTLEQINQTEWYERWPWYVTGHNLTPNFGRTWWTHDLYITELEKQYLSDNPDNLITAVGGKTLGALNYGKDKLKLAPGFAKYIIKQVARIDFEQTEK